MQDDPTNDQQPETPPTLPVRQKRRVFAISTHGDEVWQTLQPLIQWCLENGDEELRSKALRARAYWEQEQAYFIDWANRTGLFDFTRAALADLKAFKHSMRTLPPETQMTMDWYPDGQEEPQKVDVVIWLAMKAAERLSKIPSGSKIVTKFSRKREKK